MLSLAPRTAVLLTVHPKSGAAAHLPCVGGRGREGGSRGGLLAQPGTAHGGAADGAPQVRCEKLCGGVWVRCACGKGGREGRMACC